MPAQSTLFRSNRSQAVRLPKELAFPDGVKKVFVRRVGASVVITPVDALWDDFFDRPPNPDFPERFPQGRYEERERFLMLDAMLDANVCIRVIRDKPAFVRPRFHAEAGALAISMIVLYELRYGVARSDRPEVQHERLKEFLSRLLVLPFDENAAAHSGEIRADLAQAGTLICPNDLLIAGHARSLGLKLITGNLGEFSRVKGLRCEDWLAEDSIR